jgi:hypothetical protein
MQVPIARMRTRVVKKLSSQQSGAIKLARRYGAALVCVRYRQDMLGLRRYTTVELVVDEGPVFSKRADATMVDVRIGFREMELRELLMASGSATWDRKRQVWRVKYGVIKELGLTNRVVWK